MNKIKKKYHFYGIEYNLQFGIREKQIYKPHKYIFFLLFHTFCVAKGSVVMACGHTTLVIGWYILFCNVHNLFVTRSFLVLSMPIYHCCVGMCRRVCAFVMKYIWEKMVIGVLRIFDPFSSSVRWVINNTHRRLHLTCIVLSQWRRVRFYSLLLTQLRTSSGAAISTHFKFLQFAMWGYAKINSINWAIHIVLKIILLPKIWITEAWH